MRAGRQRQAGVEAGSARSERADHGKGAVFAIDAKLGASGEGARKRHADFARDERPLRCVFGRQQGSVKGKPDRVRCSGADAGKNRRRLERDRSGIE